MRRVTIEEDLLKDQPVVKDEKDVKDVCALCGSALEKDDESGEYLCPICDAEELL